MPPPWCVEGCPLPHGNLTVSVVRQRADGTRQNARCKLTLKKGAEQEEVTTDQRKTFGPLDPDNYSLEVASENADDAKLFLEIEQIAPPSARIDAGRYQSPHVRPYAVVAEQTAILEYSLVPPVLVLRTVDARFAPGFEPLVITYDIKHLESETVWLEVEGKDYPGGLVSRYTLSGPEKASGTGKTLSWDARGTQGPLSGKWLSPAYSPYKVVLKVEKKPPLQLDLKDEEETKVEVDRIDLTVDAPNDKINMNVPANKVLVTSKVYIKNKVGGSTVTPIEIDVVYSHTENAGNKTKAQSFQYQAAPAENLGKKGDPNAVFWEGHADSVSSSADGYKTKCKAGTMTAPGADQGAAKVWFKPAGVGGDKYKIKSETFAANGTTSLAAKESNELTVWRKITLVPYEMAGQTHVSTNGTTALMAAYYTADTFVEYELGAVTNVAGAFTVKYIGLWDHATSAGLNWATHSVKLAAETPTAPETADANGPAGAAQTAARAAIQTKANAWRDRIIAAYMAGLTNWAPDAAVPVNALVSIDLEHPKYSAQAPAADSVTNEWASFAWLTIAVEGRNIHPDQRWINGQGVSYGQRAYVTSGMTVARTKVVIVHEAGHETKNQFKREQFGAGDHSAAAGLMDPTASLAAFTAREKEILRGLP